MHSAAVKITPKAAGSLGIAKLQLWMFRQVLVKAGERACCEFPSKHTRCFDHEEPIFTNLPAFSVIN